MTVSNSSGSKIISIAQPQAISGLALPYGETWSSNQLCQQHVINFCLAHIPGIYTKNEEIFALVQEDDEIEKEAEEETISSHHDMSLKDKLIVLAQTFSIIKSYDLERESG
jgi:hypothetical protein